MKGVKSEMKHDALPYSRKLKQIAILIKIEFVWFG